MALIGSQCFPVVSIVVPISSHRDSQWFLTSGSHRFPVVLIVVFLVVLIGSQWFSQVSSGSQCFP